jgi:hypothetical protein
MTTTRHESIMSEYPPTKDAIQSVPAVCRSNTVASYLCSRRQRMRERTASSPKYFPRLEIANALVGATGGEPIVYP